MFIRNVHQPVPAFNISSNLDAAKTYIKAVLQYVILWL